MTEKRGSGHDIKSVDDRFWYISAYYGSVYVRKIETHRWDRTWLGDRFAGITCGGYRCKPG